MPKRRTGPSTRKGLARQCCASKAANVDRGVLRIAGRSCVGAADLIERATSGWRVYTATSRLKLWKRFSHPKSWPAGQVLIVLLQIAAHLSVLQSQHPFSRQRPKEPNLEHFSVTSDLAGMRSTGENLSPQTGELYRQASLAWHEHRFEKAIDLFEKSVEQEPDNPICLINLARAYGLNFQYTMSAETKQKVTERFGDQANVHYMLGESEFRYRNFDLADAHFHSALSLGLDQLQQIRAEVYRARIAERLHRLEDAEAFVNRALNKNPDHPMARLTKAKILERQDRSGPAVKIYEGLANGQNFVSHVRATAWYAIAKSLESEGRFDDAFHAFCSAKQMYQPHCQKVRDAAIAMRDRNYELFASMQKIDFDNWRQDLTQFDSLDCRGIAWLIGHPRSGTTLTNQIVKGHSKLVSADEVQVFPGSTVPRLFRAVATEPNQALLSVLNQADPAKLNPLRKLFVSQIENVLQQSIGDRLLFNKNPDLTLLLPAICRVFPESRFLFTVRDPRDVIISCFTKSLPLNPITVDYFTIASTAARYAASINFWLKARDFLSDNWLEVRYEDTVNDLENQARRMLGFLGLDWDEKVLDFDRRSQNEQVNSPTYVDVTRPVYKSSIGRWRNYEKQLRPVYDLLVPYLRQFGYDEVP